MTAPRTETLRSELRRVRKNLFDSFHSPGDDEQKGRDGPRRGLAPPPLTVLDVMEGQLATVLPECPLGTALALMIERRISSVPVVDAQGVIVGALNEKDVLKVFYEPEARTVSAVMTRNPIIVSIDTSLVDVVDQLMSSDFRRVLVHRDQRLVGVITRSHLMPTILRLLEEQSVA